MRKYFKCPTCSRVEPQCGFNAKSNVLPTEKADDGKEYIIDHVCNDCWNKQHPPTLGVSVSEDVNTKDKFGG